MADAKTHDRSPADPEAETDVSLDVESGGNVVVEVDLEENEALTLVNSDDTPRIDNVSATQNDDGRPRLTRGIQRQKSFRWGVSGKQLLRKSSAVNLATGQEGGRETLVQERTNQQNAMNPRERMYYQIFGKEKYEQDIMEPPQYCLTARPTQRRRRLVEVITGTRDDDDNFDVGSKADLLTCYLRWTFKTSFGMLLSVAFVCFIGLSAVFAICIHVVGIYQPSCISVGGKDYNAAGHYFLDAFQLSWTTLSTVGYGHIYPNLAIFGGPRCLAINFLCTLEAFIGLLFASCTGALIFGKVGRVQSFAPTSFSDPIVIRYGTGLLPEMADDHTESSSVKSSDSQGNPKQQFPCPSLEFRVVNRMHSVGGGEIMNCTLNVVASVLESDASEFVQQSVLHRSHRPRKEGGMGRTAGNFVAGTAKQVGSVATDTVKRVSIAAGNTAAQVGKATGTAKIASEVGKGVANVATEVGTQAAKVTGILKSPLAIKEDSSPKGSDHARRVQSVYAASVARAPSISFALVDEGSDLAPRRIFTNLEVETPAHPFFKRVWYVRHTLDENSPLLSTKAKQMIVENNGFWPDELNNYQSIRENLHFHEIIVNLSGTANATGSVVYCQKTYSFADINIGYTFARVLYRRDDGKLGVDINLLNDVVEQNGGGGEPFVFIGDSDFVHTAMGAAGNVATTAQNVSGHTQERVVVTTQNVAERTKQKVVQFKDATTDICNRVAVVGGAHGDKDPGDIESPHHCSPTGSGAKKTV